jgi:hypothetical protein
MEDKGLNILKLTNSVADLTVIGFLHILSLAICWLWQMLLPIKRD